MTTHLEKAMKDLSFVNEMQKYISDSKNELYSSIINDRRFFTSRNVFFDEQLPYSGNDSEFDFTFSGNAHTLISTWLCQKLPSVKVKDEFADRYRIAWMPKTLILMIESGCIIRKSDNKQLGEPINSYILDNRLEFETRENYAQTIELLQGTTEWSKSIDSCYIMMNQPFFYSGEKQALKKILTPDVDYIHRYRLRRRISDILRIQILEKGIWVDCDSSEIRAKCEFNTITADGFLGHRPEMWGRFNVMNEEEVESIRDIAKTSYLSMFRELIEINPPNNQVRGKGRLNFMINRRAAIRGFYFMIVNMDSSQVGNHFDYSNSYGMDPITTTSLVRNETDIEWERLPAIHHSKRIPLMVGLRVPETVGLHYHAFTNIGNFIDVENSINFDEKTEFILEYDMGRSEGRLCIFLDAIRLCRYKDGKITIISHEDPES